MLGLKPAPISSLEKVEDSEEKLEMAEEKEGKKLK